MNTRTINVGRLFARPRESAYAILRRILSVNPGVSYLDIDGFLRTALPKLHSPFDRLFALVGNEQHTTLANGNKLYRASYKRQCPICASELYHTDIYALEWLTRCQFTTWNLHRHVQYAVNHGHDCPKLINVIVPAVDVRRCDTYARQCFRQCGRSVIRRWIIYIH